MSNMPLGKSREIAPERMKRLGQNRNNAQLWMCLVVKVKSDAVNNNIAWESGILGPWIKVNWQEMAKVNTDILGISWTKTDRKGKFNSDDHYTYYCGQESLRRNGVAHIVNKRIRNAVLGCNLTNDRMILVCFQGKPFSIIVIQVYAPITNAKEAEVEQFYADLQDLLELTPKKIPSLHSCSNIYWPPATEYMALWLAMWEADLSLLLSDMCSWAKYLI